MTHEEEVKIIKSEISKLNCGKRMDTRLIRNNDIIIKALELYLAKYDNI